MTDHQDVSLEWMSTGEEPGPQVDLRPEIPHPARMYDYYLGGKDNFPADREAAEKVLSLSPLVRLSAQANRAFLQRAVRHLAELGVDRFVDIGTGIPTVGNTHETAQLVLPDARVAYLDNDPIVLVHSRALLAGAGRGTVTVRQADLREPAAILADPVVLDLLDAGQALSHATGDFTDPAQAAKGPMVYRSATAQLSLRSKDQVQRFFDGLELLEPGLVTAPQWRPDQAPTAEDAEIAIWSGVARKP
jgi:hypothetical protein